MDFPDRVDCVVDGTGLSESLISASLSILGKHILHIDRNDYYGGVLASLRFPEFEKFLNQTSDISTSCPSFIGNVLDLSGIKSSLITHKSSTWFLSDNSQKSFDDNDEDVSSFGNVNNTIVGDSANDSSIQRNHIGDEISDVIRQLDVEEQQQLQENSDENEQEICNITSRSEPSNDNVTKQQCQEFSWSRTKLQRAVRRHDIDILPKILYSHSPTVTALLRADVTRYLEFRFVSRLLAYSTDNNQSVRQPGTNSNDVGNQSGSKTSSSGCVVKIPVCRSDVFKTRLLSLHQKRALGSFFEWCFHLIINDTQPDPVNVERDADYLAYENRPFQELLSEKRKLDKFTQQLLITNLSFSNQHIKTKEAIFRIRRLLFSMGRFGPYPILWPMYGSGDLTQGYCRMSAVFGATFCLECTITKIERRSSSQATEPTSSNEAITTAVTNTSLSSSSPAVSASQSVSPRNDQDDITVHLSNGKQVRTKCVVLSPECLPFSWISKHIKQWCARAVLITDSSLLPEDCKPSDVSILAYAYSSNNQNHQDDNCIVDPILIIECQIEKTNKSYGDLFMVHMCTIIKQPNDPKKIYQPVLNCLFTHYNNNTPVTSEPVNCDDDNNKNKLPRILWAGYFCVPDLSSIPQKFPTQTESTSFNDSNIFITSGPDASPDLDSLVPNAEAIFRDIISVLGVSNTPSSNGTSTAEAPGDTRDVPQSVRSNIYTTVDATWDGQFPPRAPRPEDIVTTDEAMDPPPTVTIEAPDGDQN
uniref:RAE1/2 domain-containing protein n=1 Tax=Trichobilharzia regenti TaxID=157069 RepID=A0AA85JSE1_TRIRE|nr:unnamed protein product [Trichobilharzia regenti]